jgi:hypothetical protein
MVAVAAQTSAVFSYMAFDRGVELGVVIAAIQNLVLAAYLARSLVSPPSLAPAKPAEVGAYALLSLTAVALLPFCRGASPDSPLTIAFLTISAALIGVLGLHGLRLSRPAPVQT